MTLLVSLPLHLLSVQVTGTVTLVPVVLVMVALTATGPLAGSRGGKAAKWYWVPPTVTAFFFEADHSALLAGDSEISGVADDVVGKGQAEKVELVRNGEERGDFVVT